MINKDLIYVTIFLSLKKDLGLSIHEYLVLERINNLSYSKKYDYSCSMSKRSLAKELGLSERQVFTIINYLIKEEFLFKDEKTKYLQPSKEWCKKIEIEKNRIKKNEKEKSFYVLFFFSLKTDFDLTSNEYILLERIRSFKNSNFKCSISKEKLAEEFKLSKMQIHRMINSLIDENFIVKDKTTKYLETTNKWNDSFEFLKKQINSYLKVA